MSEQSKGRVSRYVTGGTSVHATITIINDPRREPALPVDISKGGGQHLELLPTRTNLDNLIDTLVWGNLEIVLFGEGWRHKAGKSVRVSPLTTETECMKELPRPELGGPFSISHDDGASTEVTGTLVS